MGSSVFTEALDQSMTLPDDRVETVARFSQWLYRGHYELTSIDSNVTDIALAAKRHMQLAELYVFADKYDIPQLHNNIVDKLFVMQAQGSAPPRIQLIRYVYNNTIAGSSFRKLIVGRYVWHIDIRWYSREFTSGLLALQPEFAADLAVALAGRVVGSYKSPYDGPGSAYHTAGKEIMRCKDDDGNPSNRADSTQK